MSYPSPLVNPYNKLRRRLNGCPPSEHTSFRRATSVNRPGECVSAPVVGTPWPGRLAFLFSARAGHSY